MADNTEEIYCPACGEKMLKVYMPAQGVHLDVCANGCGGIYFDNREFSKFDAPDKDIAPLLEILKDKEFKKVDETQTRKCPVCRSDMVKNFSSARNEIQVDECYHCGGKFLDYDELDKIRAEYKSDKLRSADVMKKLYADVGIENLAPINFERRNNDRKKSVLLGILFGLILAIIFLYSNSKALFSMGNNAMNISAIAIAVGLCIIGAGIGALFSKFNERPQI